LVYTNQNYALIFQFYLTRRQGRKRCRYTWLSNQGDTCLLKMLLPTIMLNVNMRAI